MVIAQGISSAAVRQHSFSTEAILSSAVPQELAGLESVANQGWTSEFDYRYLFLNYQQFQQPESEPKLKRLVGQSEIDFVVIDVRTG